MRRIQVPGRDEILEYDDRTTNQEITVDLWRRFPDIRSAAEEAYGTEYLTGLERWADAHRRSRTVYEAGRDYTGGGAVGALADVGGGFVEGMLHTPAAVARSARATGQFIRGLAELPFKPFTDPYGPPVFHEGWKDPEAAPTWTDQVATLAKHPELGTELPVHHPGRWLAQVAYAPDDRKLSGLSDLTSPTKVARAVATQVPQLTARYLVAGFGGPAAVPANVAFTAALMGPSIYDEARDRGVSQNNAVALALAGGLMGGTAQAQLTQAGYTAGAFGKKATEVARIASKTKAQIADTTLNAPGKAMKWAWWNSPSAWTRIAGQAGGEFVVEVYQEALSEAFGRGEIPKNYEQWITSGVIAGIAGGAAPAMGLLGTPEGRQMFLKTPSKFARELNQARHWDTHRKFLAGEINVHEALLEIGMTPQELEVDLAEGIRHVRWDVPFKDTNSRLRYLVESDPSVAQAFGGMDSPEITAYADGKRAISELWGAMRDAAQFAYHKDTSANVYEQYKKLGPYGWVTQESFNSIRRAFTEGKLATEEDVLRMSQAPARRLPDAHRQALMTVMETANAEHAESAIQMIEDVLYHQAMEADRAAEAAGQETHYAKAEQGAVRAFVEANNISIEALMGNLRQLPQYGTEAVTLNVWVNNKTGNIASARPSDTTDWTQQELQVLRDKVLYPLKKGKSFEDPDSGKVYKGGQFMRPDVIAKLGVTDNDLDLTRPFVVPHIPNTVQEAVGLYEAREGKKWWTQTTAALEGLLPTAKPATVYQALSKVAPTEAEMMGFDSTEEFRVWAQEAAERGGVEGLQQELTSIGVMLRDVTAAGLEQGVRISSLNQLFERHPDYLDARNLIITALDDARQAVQSQDLSLLEQRLATAQSEINILRQYIASEPVLRAGGEKEAALVALGQARSDIAALVDDMNRGVLGQTEHTYALFDSARAAVDNNDPITVDEPTHRYANPAAEDYYFELALQLENNPVGHVSFTGAHDLLLDYATPGTTLDNTIGHARGYVANTVDGRRMLFVTELQSDWAIGDRQRRAEQAHDLDWGLQQVTPFEADIAPVVTSVGKAILEAGQSMHAALPNNPITKLFHLEAAFKASRVHSGFTDTQVSATIYDTRTAVSDSIDNTMRMDSSEFFQHQRDLAEFLAQQARARGVDVDPSVLFVATESRIANSFDSNRQAVANAFADLIHDAYGDLLSGDAGNYANVFEGFAYAVLHRQGPKPPPMHLRSKWDQLMFSRLLKAAAEMNLDGIALNQGYAAGAAWGLTGDALNRRIDLYDNRFAKTLEKLIRKHGGKMEQVEIADLDVEVAEDGSFYSVFDGGEDIKYNTEAEARTMNAVEFTPEAKQYYLGEELFLMERKSQKNPVNARGVFKYNPTNETRLMQLVVGEADVVTVAHETFHLLMSLVNPTSEVWIAARKAMDLPDGTTPADLFTERYRHKHEEASRGFIRYLTFRGEALPTGKPHDFLMPLYEAMRSNLIRKADLASNIGKLRAGQAGRMAPKLTEAQAELYTALFNHGLNGGDAVNLAEAVSAMQEYSSIPRSKLIELFEDRRTAKDLPDRHKSFNLQIAADLIGTGPEYVRMLVDEFLPGAVKGADSDAVMKIIEQRLSKTDRTKLLTMYNKRAKSMKLGLSYADHVALDVLFLQGMAEYDYVMNRGNRQEIEAYQERMHLMTEASSFARRQAGRTLALYGKHNQVLMLQKLKQELPQRTIELLEAANIKWDNPTEVLRAVKMLDPTAKQRHLMQSWAYASMLSNPITQVTNTVSNSMWQVWGFTVGHAADTMADALLSGAGMIRPRRVFMSEIANIGTLYGAGRGMGEGARAAYNIIFGKEPLSSFETKFNAEVGIHAGALRELYPGLLKAHKEGNIKLNPKELLAAHANQWFSYPTRGLAAMDMFGQLVARDVYYNMFEHKVERWRKANIYEQEMRRLAENYYNQRESTMKFRARLEGVSPETYRENAIQAWIADPRMAVRYAAVDVMNYMTFHDQPSAFTQMLLDGRKKFDDTYHAMFDKLRYHERSLPAKMALAPLEALGWLSPARQFGLPFVTLISNIAKRSIEMTPGLGVVPTAFWGKGLHDVLAKQMSGLMLAFFVRMLYRMGFITGGLPEDPRERRTALNAGFTPYSLAINVGDDVQYVRIPEPFGIPTVTVIKALETWEHLSETGASSELLLKAGLEYVGDVRRHLIDNTFMRNLAELAAPRGYANRNRAFTLQSLIPFSGMLRYMADAHETVTTGQIIRRDLAVEPHELLNTTGYLKIFGQSIPGLRDQIPPRIDVYGRPIAQDKIVGGLPQAWLPRIGSEALRVAARNANVEREAEGFEAEMRRLQVYPGPMSQRLRVAGRDLELTDEQHLQMSVDFGMQVREEVYRLINSPSYRRHTSNPQVQQGLLDNLLSRLRTRARQRAIRNLDLVREARRWPTGAHVDLRTGQRQDYDAHISRTPPSAGEWERFRKPQ